MYKANNLLDIEFIKKKNEIIILHKNHYFFYQASKGICNKKINSDTKYLWINYFKETKNQKDTILFFRDLELAIKEKCNIKEKIHPFYNSNGFNISTQSFDSKLLLDLYISKDIKLALGDCPDKFYITPLIWFQNLKYSGDRWFFNIKLTQAIISPIFFRFSSCLIEESVIYDDNVLKINIVDKDKNTQLEPNNKTIRIKYLEHPTYSKYFKMILMGIPLLAVQIKLKNELGAEHLDILKNKGDDLVEVKYIKQAESTNYSKYFKMLGLGIPRKAVEQKMILDGYDINILDEPDKMIIDNVKKINDFMEMFLKVKLNRLDKTKRMKDDRKTDANKNSDKSMIHFNMEELLKKRNEIFNK